MKMNQMRLVPKIHVDVNEIDLREYQVKVKTEKEQIKRCPRERVKNLRQKLLYFLEAIIIQPRVERFSNRVEIFI